MGHCTLVDDRGWLAILWSSTNGATNVANVDLRMSRIYLNGPYWSAASAQFRQIFWIWETLGGCEWYWSIRDVRYGAKCRNVLRSGTLGSENITNICKYVWWQGLYGTFKKETMYHYIFLNLQYTCFPLVCCNPITYFVQRHIILYSELYLPKVGCLWSKIKGVFWKITVMVNPIFVSIIFQ